MNNTELGRRIKQLRLAQALTLKDIESKGGVSATHVSEIERGKTSPTVGALAKIAEALEVNPSFLVDLPVGLGQRCWRRQIYVFDVGGVRAYFLEEIRRLVIRHR